MGIKPIQTKADYRAVLKEIDTLMAAKLHTPAGERLDVAPIAFTRCSTANVTREFHSARRCEAD